MLRAAELTDATNIFGQHRGTSASSRSSHGDFLKRSRRRRRGSSWTGVEGAPHKPKAAPERHIVSFASPACAPSASPTSCAREVGTQIIVRHRRKGGSPEGGSPDCRYSRRARRRRLARRSSRHHHPSASSERAGHDHADLPRRAGNRVTTSWSKHLVFTSTPKCRLGPPARR